MNKMTEGRRRPKVLCSKTGAKIRIWEIPRGSNFKWVDRQINSIGAVT